MGMSQLEFYLCRKHLPENKIVQITKDKSYSKQALRDFVKDLVDIIYFDKPIFLTGDSKLAAKIKSEMFE